MCNVMCVSDDRQSMVKPERRDPRRWKSSTRTWSRLTLCDWPTIRPMNVLFGRRPSTRQPIVENDPVLVSPSMLRAIEHGYLH